MVLTGKKMGVAFKEAVRNLRAQATPSEKKFWNLVRLGRLGGYRFRRQHPIEPYVVDFFCLEAKLVVEIVGSIHDRADQAAKDREREAFIRMLGFNYIEFTDAAVLTEPSRVKEALMNLLHSTLPPKGGGGRRRRSEGGLGRSEGGAGSSKGES